MYPSIVVWCIIFIFKSVSVDCRVPINDFFLFGPGHGDERLPKGNKYFVSRRLDLSDPTFSFYGVMLDYAHVSTYGQIEFAKGTVIPFNAEFDTSKRGNIYARKSTNAADLGKAQNEICSAFPLYCDVKLRWAIIATFDHVVPFNFTYSGSNTLQVALASDGTKTFVILYYNSVDWFESYEEDNKKIWYSDARFTMSTGNGTEYNDGLPGSGTFEMLTLEHRSNCGFAGKWMFRVDGETICAPDTACSDPNDPHDSCHTQTYSPVMKWLLVIGCVVLVTCVAVYLHLKHNICSFQLLRGHFSRAQSAIQNLFHGYFRFNNDDDTLLV